MFFLQLQENILANSSTKVRSKVIEAITNTIQTVLGQSSTNETSRSKRTMLKKPDGRIMTEQYVIDQMEEKERLKTTKKTTKRTIKSKQTSKIRLNIVL